MRKIISSALQTIYLIRLSSSSGLRSGRLRRSGRPRSRSWHGRVRYAIVEVIAGVITGITGIVATVVMSATRITAGFTAAAILSGSGELNLCLTWIETGELFTGHRIDCTDLGKARRQNAELDRNQNLLLAGDAEGDDQIGFDGPIGADGQVTAHIVGGQTGLAGRVAKFREPRKVSRIQGGWDTQFKEIGQRHGIGCLGDVHLCANRERNFMIEAVTEQKVQANLYVPGYRHVLRSEQRRSQAPFVAAGCVRIDQFFGISTIRSHHHDVFPIGILYKVPSGNGRIDVQFQVTGISRILRIEEFFTANINDPLQPVASGNCRGKALVGNRLDPL